MTQTHRTVEQAIIYLGTPVILNITINPNGSFNLAPISSVFWLGWRAMMGFEAVSQTAMNIIRTGECVINLPSDAMVDCVNHLSRTTGSNPVPPGKAQRGYRHEADKFGVAGLTPIASETVAAPRVLECPIQLEASFVQAHSVMADEYDYAQHERSKECTLEGITCLEVRITRVHVAPSLLMKNDDNRIDPDLWRPMIMSFCRYYGLGPEIAKSKLADIPEAQYRSPDVDRTRLAKFRAA